MEIEKKKHEAISIIDRLRKKLIFLSLNIHSNPELGFSEVKTSGWLTDLLKENGFEVKLGVDALETAFIAELPSGPDIKPCIAFLAENDVPPLNFYWCGGLQNFFVKV